MKKLFIFSVLVVVFVGFSSCGGTKDNLSSEKDILSFKVGSNTWQLSGTQFSFSYDKGTEIGNLSPSIEISPKATVKPASGESQDFSNEKAVTYTVTAEDGSTKTYTAKAIVKTQ